MATPEQAMTPPPIAVRRGTPRLTWILWIVVSMAGTVIGALIAWRIRTLFLDGPASLRDALRYLATIAAVIVASGAQWLLLNRFRLDVYWWVPATVAATLISAIIVIPAVLTPFTPPLGVVMNPETAMLSAGSALAASGLVIGIAQGLVLRASVGNAAWAWVPATVIGGALGGAATEAMSAQVFGLPVYVTLGLLAATSSMLTAASQAPIVLRILR